MIKQSLDCRENFQTVTTTRHLVTVLKLPPDWRRSMSEIIVKYWKPEAYMKQSFSLVTDDEQERKWWISEPTKKKYPCGEQGKQ